MADAQRVFGGLLSGLGEGILINAHEKRRRALLQFEADTRAGERAEDRAYQDERDERQYGRDLERDETTNRRADERSGREHRNALELEELRNAGDLAVARKGLTGDASGLSIEDQRLLDTTIERYTTSEGLKGETVDWQGVTERLRNSGRDDLAALVAPSESETRGVDVESSEYREAQRQAEEWASDKAGLLSRDKTDFADYGGNRAEAIRQKTMELYEQLSGRKAPSEVANPGSAASATSSAAPQGAGTQESPYQPTTQAEFDQLPAGAVYVNPADGKLYRKN